MRRCEQTIISLHFQCLSSYISILRTYVVLKYCENEYCNLCTNSLKNKIVKWEKPIRNEHFVLASFDTHVIVKRYVCCFYVAKSQYAHAILKMA